MLSTCLDSRINFTPSIMLFSIFGAESFNPIYNTFVHEAVCVQGVSGLTWIFATTLTMAIFSMIMLMFRAAMYPVREAPCEKYANNGGADEEAVKYFDGSQQEVEEEGHEVETAEPVKLY